MMTRNPLSLAVQAVNSGMSPFNDNNKRTLRDPRASTRRYKTKGSKFILKAREFLDAFPIGSSLSPTQFDEFAISKGWLSSCDTNSDSWDKHTSDRNKLRKQINLGGGSQHMPEKESFKVRVSSHRTKDAEGTYIVDSTYEAYSVSASEMGDTVSKWVRGQLEELERLGSSTDMEYMDQTERLALYHVTTGLRDLDSTFSFHLEQHENKMREMKRMIDILRQNIPSSAESNGGFTALDKLPI